MRKKWYLMILPALAVLLCISSSVFAEVKSTAQISGDKQGALVLQISGEEYRVSYVEQMKGTAKRYTLEIGGLDAVPEEQKTVAAGELLRQLGFSDAAEELREETLLAIVTGTELSILRQNASRNEDHYFAVARTRHNDYEHSIVGFANQIDPELSWELRLDTSSNYAVDHDQTRVMLHYTDPKTPAQRQTWTSPTAMGETGKDELLVYKQDLSTGAGMGIAFDFAFRDDVSNVFLETYFYVRASSVDNPAEFNPIISGSLQSDAERDYRIIVDFPQGFRVKFHERYEPIQLY